VNGFIDHSYTRLGNTNTAPPPISTIHKSPQHSLSLFQPAVSSRAVPWQRLLTVEILQLHTLKSTLHKLVYRTQLNKLRHSCRLEDNSSARTTWKRPVSNSTSTVACRFVAVGKCLPSRCLETALVYLLISRSLRSNGSTRYNIFAERGRKKEEKKI
jgi:hypothetical protein